jgi:phosphoglycerol transferase MdoB-like AlkP superfamily enzyme
MKTPTAPSRRTVAGSFASMHACIDNIGGRMTMSFGSRDGTGAAAPGTTRMKRLIADSIPASDAGWRSTLRRLALTPDGRLSRTAILCIAVLITLPAVHYVWKHEGGAANKLLVSSATMTFAAGMVLVFGRVLVASVLANAFIGVMATLAWAKYQATDMVLHGYDIVLHLSSWSKLASLWPKFQVEVIALITATLATATVAAIAYRLDGRPVRRRTAFVLVAGLAFVTAVVADTKPERRHAQYYWDSMYLSSFYSSWAETIETLWRGQLIEAAGSTQGAQFVLPTDCVTTTKPPHIILIHAESAMPPGIFPGLDYDHGIDRLFVSQDRTIHRLRVETYGGASWLTEFSVLTGISASSFGGMQQLVQPLMTDKLRDTLPQTLDRCGYRNIIFYPLMRNFVSNAKFYASVGIKELFDAKDQGAQTYDKRDRFYFGNALDEIARHLQQSRQPLFTMIFTIAAHWPYDTVYMPEVDVPGGGPGTDPEMSEYLRRLAMARIDYEDLLSDIARRFPGERFLIVRYGDHHPVATRSLLGIDTGLDAEDILLPPESPGFITYYAVEGINYQSPSLPAVETLDVPYLPLVILTAAGLPLSDSFRERQRLMIACNGRYYTCTPRDPILAFHRRLIDSGLIDAH